MQADWISRIHSFWFEELSPNAWFRADPATDDAIRVRFLDLYRNLKGEPFGVLIRSPVSAVASVIVFDQLPRNMFRGTPDAFATDPHAFAVADAAVAVALDKGLGTSERQFLYMPFMHSEDPGAQQRSVALYTPLGIPEALSAAEEHKAIIDRFGRFPHRNAILGRLSTPAEIDFLKDAPPFG